MKCPICRESLPNTHQHETCGKSSCLQGMKIAANWAKGAVSRILSHWTPAELAAMRVKNNAAKQARASVMGRA